MTKSSKIIIWAIVILVIVAGIWWYFSRPSASPTQPIQTGSAGGTVTAGNNSNAALDQDLSTIDSQLNSLSADSASIDQGLNDQPITQGQ